jgi:hypothetical protein
MSIVERNVNRRRPFQQMMVCQFRRSIGRNASARGPLISQLDRRDVLIRCDLAESDRVVAEEQHEEDRN